MNIDIGQITKTITRKQRGLEDPVLIHPARDWAIGMVGTLVLILGAVLFSVIEYRAYTDVSLSDEVVQTMVPYRAAQVEQAITKYQARAAAHAAITAGGPVGEAGGLGGVTVGENAAEGTVNSETAPEASQEGASMPEVTDNSPATPDDTPAPVPTPVPAIDLGTPVSAPELAM